MAALDVNPDEVHRTASGWRSYAAEFVAQSPPSVGDGDGWASQAATSAFHERMHNANNVFHRRLQTNADLIDDSARNYTQQDDYGAADMQAAGLNDSAATASGPTQKDMASIFSGTFKDLSGALTAGLSSGASGFGALGSSVASAAGAAANATTQIGTTLAQNAAKSGPAGVGPAIVGANGNVARTDAGQGGDSQTHVASTAPAEVPVVPAAAPAGAALVREDSAVATSTAVAPAAMAPYGPRASTEKAVRRVVAGGDRESDAVDDRERPSVLPSPMVYPPAFAKAVVEVPDAGKP